MPVENGIGDVLYSVEITRFSSLLNIFTAHYKFCTLLKLQGSQAGLLRPLLRIVFCTLLKLQGSQARRRSCIRL